MINWWRERRSIEHLSTTIHPMQFTLKAVQLIVGISLGLAGIGAIIGGAGYYFFLSQTGTYPPKPTFAEERQPIKTAAKASPPAKSGTKPSPSASAKPSPSPSVIKPEVAKDPTKATKLPPAAYDAKVIWPDGVSLKLEPTQNAGKNGGVGFNEKVAIVKESDDKQWVLIQPEKSDIQGWVKAGNVDKAKAKLQAQEEKESDDSLDTTPQSPAPKKTPKPTNSAKPQSPLDN
jgi:hypothetical protein